MAHRIPLPTREVIGDDNLDTRPRCPVCGQAYLVRRDGDERYLFPNHEPACPHHRATQETPCH